MHKNTNQPTSIKMLHAPKPRRGAVVVLCALMLPVLLLIFGFCIDYATMLRVRNEAQVIADLAAKAATDTLARTNDEALATQAAMDVAAANSIGGTSHTLAPDEIIFGRAEEQTDGSFVFTDGGTPANSVRVVANRFDTHPSGAVNLNFGNLYGHPMFDVSQTATASFRDVEIIVVLDRSISMKFPVVGPEVLDRMDTRCFTPAAIPGCRWLALDVAMEAFLNEFDATPVQERIGVVTFSTDVSNDSCGTEIVLPASKLDQPLTTNTSAIRDIMDDYNNSVWFGGTNITAGILEALDHFRDAGNTDRERFIVVLTDGNHTANGVSLPETVAADCFAEGIIVHTITFSDAADESGMIRVANMGGGDHFHAVDTLQLTNIFRRLAGKFSIIVQ